jgi:hypothetical protein
MIDLRSYKLMVRDLYINLLLKKKTSTNNIYYFYDLSYWVTYFIIGSSLLISTNFLGASG